MPIMTTQFRTDLKFYENANKSKRCSADSSKRTKAGCLQLMANRTSIGIDNIQSVTSAIRRTLVTSMAPIPRH